MKTLVAVWLLLISVEVISQTIQLPDSSKVLAGNKEILSKMQNLPATKPGIVLPLNSMTLQEFPVYASGIDWKKRD